MGIFSNTFSALSDEAKKKLAGAGYKEPPATSFAPTWFQSTQKTTTPAASAEPKVENAIIGQQTNKTLPTAPKPTSFGIGDKKIDATPKEDGLLGLFGKTFYGSLRGGMVENFGEFLKQQSVLKKDEDISKPGPVRALREATLPPEQVEGKLEEGRALAAERLRSTGEKLAESGIQFVEENPELQKPKDIGDFLDGGYSDPRWYAATLGSGAPQVLGSLGIAGSVTYATKNPLAGISAGIAAMFPQEAGSANKEYREELIASGMSEEEALPIAAKNAQTYGMISAVLENALGAKIFGKAFSKNPAVKKVKKSIVNFLIKAAKTTGVNIGIEGSTEALQEASMITIGNSMEEDKSAWVGMIEAFKDPESRARILESGFAGGLLGILGVPVELMVDSAANNTREEAIENTHKEIQKVTGLSIEESKTIAELIFDSISYVGEQRVAELRGPGKSPIGGEESSGRREDKNSFGNQPNPEKPRGSVPELDGKTTENFQEGDTVESVFSGEKFEVLDPAKGKVKNIGTGEIMNFDPKADPLFSKSTGLVKPSDSGVTSFDQPNKEAPRGVIESREVTQEEITASQEKAKALEEKAAAEAGMLKPIEGGAAPTMNQKEMFPDTTAGQADIFTEGAKVEAVEEIPMPEGFDIDSYRMEELEKAKKETGPTPFDNLSKSIAAELNKWGIADLAGKDWPSMVKYLKETGKKPDLLAWFRGLDTEVQEIQTATNNEDISVDDVWSRAMEMVKPKKAYPKYRKSPETKAEKLQRTLDAQRTEKAPKQTVAAPTATVAEQIKALPLDKRSKVEKLIAEYEKAIQRARKTGVFPERARKKLDILPKVAIPEGKAVDRMALEKAGIEIPQAKLVTTEARGLKERINAMKRGATFAERATKQEIAAVQNELTRIIKDSPLEAKDKTKFLTTIKNINSREKLDKFLPQIEERIKSLEQAELRRGITDKISEELKGIKPIKKGSISVSRYDYETNKFLQNLKDINQYNQAKAQDELANAKLENLSNADLIRNRMLSFKANGAKSSIALQKQVLADIQELKAIGEEAKDELDFQKKLEKQAAKDEVLEGIKNQKESKVVLKQLKATYISSVSNLYSAINAIAGKDIADKYDYGIFQTNSKQDSFVKIEESTNKAKKIYGVENNKQLTKIFIDDLAKKEYKITETGGLSQEISKLDLMNIYNGTKNDLIRERYYNTFGEEQINSLLQNLTPEDAQMADYLMGQVQSYKDILNQRNIEIRGMDNGTVENYWPSVSEFTLEFFDDIRVQGEVPSAMKERNKSSKVIPKMANAWLLSQKNIAEAEHVKTVSRKYEELKNLFSDRVIRRTIEEKYGDDAYRALMKHVETFSLNYRTEGLDIVSGVYNSALNNWVRAKVSSPTVFARQLISSIYSIEKIGIKNFAKYQKEVITNPKKAFDYMWNNVPFIKNRFNMGYSEALEDVIRGTKKMSFGMDGITKYTTLMTRGGDITAIVISGYPIIKSEMAKHGDIERAIKEFQRFTEKTQQSPSESNISDPQRNRGPWHKTFFRFKNTTNQLLRLQVDANIQFANNQISAKDYATKTFLYSIYTPIMYVLTGYAVTQGFKKLFGTDDEDEKDSLPGDFLQNIIIQPFQAIPFLDMSTEWTYSKIRQKLTGKELNYSMFSYPLFDDIASAGSKLFKKEPSAMDILEALSLIQEPATGIPTGAFLRYFGYATEGKKSSTKEPQSSDSSDFVNNLF